MVGRARQPRGRPGKAGRAKVTVKAEPHDGARHTPVGRTIRKKPAFLPFKKALLYAHSLKLKTAQEWNEWCKSGKRPAHVPSTPSQTYKHDGWQGYRHWLGTGNLVGGKLDFLPFKKALLYARSLKLKTQQEWKVWCKTGARPANVPSSPERTYKCDGWQGVGHWLGTANVRTKNFLPFTEALEYARSLKLKNKAGWEVWRKSGTRTEAIPSAPDKTYKHEGWQGYGHWLGTGNIHGKDKQFLPFQKALLYARALKLKSQDEWRVWCKSGPRPANVPSAPNKIYKVDGWQGFGHWLGTGTVAPQNKEFLPFKQALSCARSLKLNNLREWQSWCKSGARPAYIPSSPNHCYQHEGWQGFVHWLGKGNISGSDEQGFLPFKKALLYARCLKLKSSAEWEVWRKSGARPANIPSHPDATYTHEGWQGYGHWLGTGTVAPQNKQFLPFKKALLHARSLKLKTGRAWSAWCKSGARPGNVPSHPDQIYALDGWQGVRHWLGTGAVADKDTQFPSS